MEQNIRLILLAIGAIIILLILYDGLRRKKRRQIVASENQLDSQNTPQQNVSQSQDVGGNASLSTKDEKVHDSSFSSFKDSIVSITIVPDEAGSFNGGELLQTLFTNDLHYGDMQLFHYYSPNPKEQNKALFSLASASKSGDFNLGTMRSSSYNGLILFMYPAEHLCPEEVFDTMVATAQKIATELHGKLISQHKQIWSDEIASQMREMLRK
jgi:cell division protein ZipA